MFEKRTVFIVGAGGSVEFGLPMGAELTKIISQKLHVRSDGPYSKYMRDENIYYAILEEAKRRVEKKPTPLYHAAMAISEGMAQAISIDNFLHTHSSNQDIIFMGKLAIAAAILDAEKSSIIASSNNNRQQIPFGSIDESWHTVFVKMLLENMSIDSFEDVFRNVSIITFNYDRCIEHYLVQSIMNYLLIPRVDAQNLVGKLNIIHPYGKVGNLPWQGPNGVNYGQEYNWSQLSGIAAQIRTFTERVDDETILNNMHKTIGEAEVVVYLGFSYGDMNMKLMTLDSAGERVVYGTSYGISEPNKRVIKSEVTNSMSPFSPTVNRIELADLKCKEFLEAYWKPIMRGI